MPLADPNSLATSPDNSAAPATAPANAGGAKGALNPEHGAPGHRCDIPVGAPLNSPAGQAPAASPLSGAVPTMMPAQAPAPTGTAAKGQRLNPEHGAPGHDCAVPVGQPLKG